MAAYIVDEIVSLINNQLYSQEEIQGYLLKAEALAHIAAVSQDFLESERSILVEYLGTLSDTISQSVLINRRALASLQKKGRHIKEKCDDFF